MYRRKSNSVLDDCRYKVNKLFAVNKLPCDCPDRCELVLPFYLVESLSKVQTKKMQQIVT